MCVFVERVCLWHGVLFGKVEHIQIDAVCIPICFGVAVLTLCGSELLVLFDGEPSTPGWFSMSASDRFQVWRRSV